MTETPADPANARRVAAWLDAHRVTGPMRFECERFAHFADQALAVQDQNDIGQWVDITFQFRDAVGVAASAYPDSPLVGMFNEIYAAHFGYVPVPVPQPETSWAANAPDFLKLALGHVAEVADTPAPSLQELLDALRTGHLPDIYPQPMPSLFRPTERPDEHLMTGVNDNESGESDS